MRAVRSFVQGLFDSTAREKIGLQNIRVAKASLHLAKVRTLGQAPKYSRSSDSKLFIHRSEFCDVQQSCLSSLKTSCYPDRSGFAAKFLLQVSEPHFE
jgi:hypothetical protein